ncbi:hypothetical protein [Streptomyces albogriseolus]|uniref:hypothetical protein n=1 Tax=Streptomyces albogriseolus TaxID=1887 RepID=UPI0033AB6C09
MRGLNPTTAVTVAPGAQGRGLSALTLTAPRDTARAHGFDDVASVRAGAEHLEPRTPVEECVRRVGSDGVSEDPWTRVHDRVGAAVERLAPTVMTVSAFLA